MVPTHDVRFPDVLAKSLLLIFAQMYPCRGTESQFFWDKKASSIRLFVV
jgi:hypothetical protein